MTWIIWNQTKNVMVGTTTLPDEEAAGAHLSRYLSSAPPEEQTDDYTFVEVPDA